MKEVTLGDIAEWGSGGTPKRDVSEYFGAGIPWLSITDLNDGLITHCNESLTPAGIANSSAKVVPPGTLFVAMYGASIGKLGIAGSEMATSQAIAFAKPRTDLVDERYLFHYLLAQRDKLRHRGRGGAQPNIGQSDLKAWPIPLPPLPEQRRIATILDHADSLRTKRRQVLTHLDSLPSTIFLSIFGDPASNPHQFKINTIQSLALKFSDGPFGSNLKSAHYTDAGIPVVRLQNIGIGRYLNNDRAFISPDHYTSLSRHDCKPNDVLIGTLGDPNLRACLQPESMPIALNKADCIQMRVDPAVAVPEFACWLLNMDGTMALANSLVLGQTRSRISMGRLRNLRIPIPPIELQRKFASRIRELTAQRELVENSMHADELLFKSIQAQAFQRRS